MSSKRLKCVRSFLDFLLKDCISSKQARLLLSNLTNGQVKAISEIAHNVLHSRLRLKKDFEKIIKKYKLFFKKIGKNRLSLSKKKELIKKKWLRVWTTLISLKNILKKVW
jgi:hypothetical protein